MVNKELEPGKKYSLKYTGQFCHAYNDRGYIDPEKILPAKAIYLNRIEGTASYEGYRDIFVIFRDDISTTYIMFGTYNMNHVSECNEYMERIEEVERKIKELKDEILRDQNEIH